MTEIDEADFELFVHLSEELGNTQLLKKLLISLSGQALDYNTVYIDTVLHLLGNPAEHNISATTADTLIECISSRLGKVRLSADSLVMLFRAYIFTEN